MAEDIDICFSEDFLKNLKKFYPDTGPEKFEEFKEYLRERICEAMKKIDSVENGIRLNKVHFGIDPECPEMSIDLDSASPKYETAYLQVREEIVKPLSKTRKGGKLIKDIICELKFQEKCKNIKVFSHGNLLHEFGHLQDAQRTKFGYTHEHKNLHKYIDLIWNVLLESRLSRSQISGKDKKDNWDSYRKRLEDLEVSPDKKKDFEYLWEKRHYCYPEIVCLAQSYSDASQVNRS